jgi:hypothetical protein
MRKDGGNKKKKPKKIRRKIGEKPNKNMFFFRKDGSSF